MTRPSSPPSSPAPGSALFLIRLSLLFIFGIRLCRKMVVSGPVTPGQVCLFLKISDWIIGFGFLDGNWYLVVRAIGSVSLESRKLGKKNALSISLINKLSVLRAVCYFVRSKVSSLSLVCYVVTRRRIQCFFVSHLKLVWTRIFN